MTYYTNCIDDLMTDIADVEVKKLDEVGELTNVTVYLFDNLFDCWEEYTKIMAVLMSITYCGIVQSGEG